MVFSSLHAASPLHSLIILRHFCAERLSHIQLRLSLKRLWAKGELQQMTLNQLVVGSECKWIKNIPKSQLCLEKADDYKWNQNEPLLLHQGIQNRLKKKQMRRSIKCTLSTSLMFTLLHTIIINEYGKLVEWSWKVFHFVFEKDKIKAFLPHPWNTFDQISKSKSVSRVIIGAIIIAAFIHLCCRREIVPLEGAPSCSPLNITHATLALGIALTITTSCRPNNAITIISLSLWSVDNKFFKWLSSLSATCASCCALLHRSVEKVRAGLLKSLIDLLDFKKFCFKNTKKRDKLFEFLARGWDLAGNHHVFKLKQSKCNFFNSKSFQQRRKKTCCQR